MIDIPIGLTSRQFAYEDGKGGFKDIHLSAMQVRMCGSDFGKAEPVIPIIPVLVTVDEEGTYWGWYSAERMDVSMIFAHRTSLEICFPYGSKIEEDRDRGRVVRLRVTWVVDPVPLPERRFSPNETSTRKPQ